MADLKATDMKDEKIAGWKAQVLALYQSLVVFIFGSVSFILRLMQEYFKMGEPKWSSEAEDKPKSSTDVGGKSKLRSAGEHVAEEGGKQSQESLAHTVVVLPPAEIAKASMPPAAAAEVPKVEAEPHTDQSKNTLVIKNLPFKFKPADLDKLLSDNNAKPKNVRLLRDESGRFSGMAFIRCPSKEEAQRLILILNGMDIGGRIIQVDFKLKKKKKGKLDSSLSCDSLSSSSDELPGNRLRISSEPNSQVSKLSELLPVDSPIIIQSAVSPAASGHKLSMSAEHAIFEKSQSPLKKVQNHQTRRKSTSSAVEPSHYTNSTLPRVPSNEANNKSGVRPIPQPGTQWNHRFLSGIQEIQSTYLDLALETCVQM